MGKKANPAVIGAFVVGGIALAVALVLLLGGGKLFKDTDRYVLFFEGSVKGLKVGSPVVFRGVPIGSVTDVRMRIDPDILEVDIPVFIEVDPQRVGAPEGRRSRRTSSRDVELMIQKGLRAQLVTQSFVTGQLMIQFDFYPDAPVNLQGFEYGVKELPTIPTPMQELTRTLENLNLGELGRKLGAAMESFTEALGSPEVGEGLGALTNILSETEALIREVRAGIAPVLTGADLTLQDTQQLLHNLDGTVDNLRGEVGEALGDTRTLVQRVDGKVDPLASDTRQLLQKSTLLVEHTDQATAALRDFTQVALGSADVALKQATETLKTVESTLEGDSVISYEVTTTLQEVAAAARSIRALSDLLQQRPDVLLRGKATGGK